MFFKKNKAQIKRVDCIDISADYISTGQMGSYIKHLYNTRGFRHIGYEFDNMDGMCRFIIYTLPGQKQVMQYFKDRCPAMVEQECINAPSLPFKTVTWDDGYTEVSCVDE